MQNLAFHFQTFHIDNGACSMIEHIYRTNVLVLLYADAQICQWDSVEVSYGKQQKGLCVSSGDVP